MDDLEPLPSETGGSDGFNTLPPLPSSGTDGTFNFSSLASSLGGELAGTSGTSSTTTPSTTSTSSAPTAGATAESTPFIERIAILILSVVLIAGAIYTYRK